MPDPLDDDTKLVQNAADALAEHFDSVQVFVTRHNGSQDSVGHISRGTGNWFTRFGQIRIWLLRQEEAEKEQMRQQVNE